MAKKWIQLKHPCKFEVGRTYKFEEMGTDNWHGGRICLEVRPDGLDDSEENMGRFDEDARAENFYYATPQFWELVEDLDED